ncbi:hypothetical protein ACIPUC_17710 [Streptomyces sp. LARHCF249]
MDDCTVPLARTAGRGLKDVGLHVTEAVTARRQASCASKMRDRRLLYLREQPKGLMLTDC